MREDVRVVLRAAPGRARSRARPAVGEAPVGRGEPRAALVLGRAVAVRTVVGRVVRGGRGGRGAGLDGHGHRDGGGADEAGGGEADGGGPGAPVTLFAAGHLVLLSAVCCWAPARQACA